MWAHKVLCCLNDSLSETRDDLSCSLYGPSPEKNKPRMDSGLKSRLTFAQQTSSLDEIGCIEPFREPFINLKENRP